MTLIGIPNVALIQNSFK